MPVIEIARLIVRSGNLANLPNPSFEEGEFGLALDAGRLFIGTPNLAEVQDRMDSGVSPYGNTEILTEWSPNVESLIQYTYRNRYNSIDGATPYTGASSSSRIYRILQEKLDDYVSVKDYGAKGDGRYDNVSSKTTAELNAETYALRRAALDVSLTKSATNQEGAYNRRALVFPAGVYEINDTLYLPPNSTWIGAGKDKTIVVLTDTTVASVLETISGQATISDLDNDTLNNYVGANILIDPLDETTFKNLPRNIVVSGITFLHLGNQDVLRAFRMSNALFIDCEFKSNYVTGSKNTGTSTNYDTANDSVAIMIDGLGNGSTSGWEQYQPTDIHFVNCKISHSTYGFLATSDQTGINFDQCLFTCLYRGVSLGESPYAIGPLSTPTPASSGVPKGGPRAVKITNSLFKNIEREGFVVWTTHTSLEYVDVNNGGGFNTSAFNRYENVGYGLDSDCQPTGTAISPVIRFVTNSAYNSSISDTFSRNVIPTDSTNYTDYRIAKSNLDTNIILNAQDPFTTPLIVSTNGAIIEANAAAWTSFDPPITFPLNTVNSVMFDFSYKKNSAGEPHKIGTLQIISNGTNVSFTENSVLLDPSAENTVDLNVVVSGSNIEVQYSNSDPANDGIMAWTAKAWNI